MLTWNVKNFDMNKRVIVDHDVLKYKEPIIRKLKKLCNNKAEFSEEFARELKWQYWKRSEYELMISIKNDRVFLSPSGGCREPEKATIDITDNTWLDWLAFAKHHCYYDDEAKIDIWDQLAWNWQELVDYCWHTRLPYERKLEKFIIVD